ncbi:hypothetical protein Tsubulata_009351 [Turnera subulata]|uniref:RING-type domain-containing protein n=1 Tax=Turnera subulata TaxID=218843 RepID=A0A9Q0GGA5_9ROSI|nr:hypothetical protein Tsubulata_009351 [Turnera subulata]
MGCTAREKHVRANRRPKPGMAKQPPLVAGGGIPVPVSKSMLESGLDPFGYHLGLHDPGRNPNPNAGLDENGWGYCTEEELEELLLRNLECLYKEAVAKVVGMGYDEETALKAVLRSGHCYGGMDVLTNILHNSLGYLSNSGSSAASGGGGGNNGNLEESELAFNDLRQLVEYSLAGMVCLLQQVRPHLSKGDAMWCLVMSDLHVGRASSIEMPMGNNSSGNGNGNVSGGGNLLVQNSLESVGSNGVDHGIGMVAPALCRFHGGWGFGSGGVGPDFAVNGFFSYSAELTVQRDIDCPKRFNLSPAMKNLLKRNVAMFAAGFRANSRQLQMQSQMPSQACMSVLSNGNVAPVVTGGEVSAESGEESQNAKNQDGVNSVLSKFRDLNLDENIELPGEDQKDEMIVTLLHQVKELERQVKERKEWAHEKAMQAARKLSTDLTELKMLRMEREETQRLKKGKQTLEDSTMKRLSEMENALRKASGQVDRANAAVRRLENENAEIRAEMEASKLSASESVTTCLEVAKREKKCLKRLLAWEKQKAKLQDEIAAEKEKIKELNRCLSLIKQAQKETEDKWRQEIKEKEQALTQVEEERCAKEAAEATNKRQLEALRLKIEIDFQRHKDDLQRLEQEFSRLKSSAESTELNQQSNASPLAKPEKTKPQEETIASMLDELDRLEGSTEKGAGCGRECMICMKDEVCIVFLPCAHQVMCATCSDNYGKKGKATCPCCRVLIEQRIRVFGASS